MVNWSVYNIVKLDFFFTIFVFGIFLLGCLVFANQPTVHSGGVSTGGYVAVATGVSDMKQGTNDRLHMTCDIWHMAHDT